MSLHNGARNPDKEFRILQRQKDALDELDIGYGGIGYNLRLGKPVKITSKEHIHMVGLGEVFFSMLKVANTIYKEALEEGQDIITLIEGGLPKKVKEFQRRLYVGKEPPLPHLLRADLIDLETAVEVNIPGGGLSLMDVLPRICTPHQSFAPGVALGWMKVIREVTKKSRPTAFLTVHNKKVKPSVEHFCRSLKKLGIDTKMYGWDDPLPRPEEVDFLERFDMRKMVKMDGFYSLFEAYRKGDIHIEPPPSSLYESKIPELLAFMPGFAERFPEEVRKTFPMSVMVKPGLRVPYKKNGHYELQDIDQLYKLPGSQRRWVLKLAGASDENGKAGKGVFQLDGKAKGINGAEGLLLTAVDDLLRKGKPWLIQERMRSKHKVKVLNEDEGCVEEKKVCARFMPYYTRTGSEVELVNATVLYDTNWKVHGSSNAIHCALYVSDVL